MNLYKMIVASVFPIMAFAGELTYFDSKIDFWGEKPKVPAPATAAGNSEASKDGKFPWKTYLDPQNKEFFKEGDYTPPEPFMEIARNPTDENIKNWFEFMQKKNELAKRLDMRVREYLAKNGEASGVPPSPLLSTPAKASPEPPAPLDPARFKVRMYFESTCPHCRRMFGVLKRLQDEGVEVHALQIDRGPVPADEEIVPLGMATQEEIRKHGIKGVPFLLIADTKKKILMPPVQGYHDFDEVVRLLKSASR